MGGPVGREDDAVPGRVSVVVPTRAGADLLPSCLAALAAQDYGDLEIVLVDDGGRDGSAPRAARGAPRIRLVTLPRPRGFARAANAGIRAATGAWVLLLNDDAVAAPDAVSLLVGAAVEVGADLAGPRLMWAGARGVLDNAGHALYADGLNWCRGRGHPPRGALMRRGDLLLPSGAAMLVSRRLLRAVGSLDEGFVAYGEDADLGLRAARAGFAGVYVPEAVVEHRISATYGRSPFLKAYRVERNRARIAALHLPWRDLLASPAHTVARHAALAWASRGGRSPRPDLPRPWLAASAVLLAHAASLAGLPGDLRRRALLSRTLPMPPSYRARLRAHRISARALAGLAPGPWEEGPPAEG